MLFFEGNIAPAAYAMEWRVCPRFQDYEVSECGDVRRRTAARNRPLGFQLRGSITWQGYVAYSLAIGPHKTVTIPAYRLVAEAFLGPQPTPKHEVAHRNGSKVGAHWRDLRWATKTENNADMAMHGTWRNGQRNGNAKVTEEQVLQIRREYWQIKRGEQGRRDKVAQRLGAKYGLSQPAIHKMISGETWKHLPLEVG